MASTFTIFRRIGSDPSNKNQDVEVCCIRLNFIPRAGEEINLHGYPYCIQEVAWSLEGSNLSVIVRVRSLDLQAENLGQCLLHECRRNKAECDRRGECQHAKLAAMGRRDAEIESLKAKLAAEQKRFKELSEHVTELHAKNAGITAQWHFDQDRLRMAQKEIADLKEKDPRKRALPLIQDRNGQKLYEGDPVYVQLPDETQWRKGIAISVASGLLKVQVFDCQFAGGFRDLAPKHVSYIEPSSPKRDPFDL